MLDLFGIHFWQTWTPSTDHASGRFWSVSSADLRDASHFKGNLHVKRIQSLGFNPMDTRTWNNSCIKPSTTQNLFPNLLPVWLLQRCSKFPALGANGKASTCSCRQGFWGWLQHPPPPHPLPLHFTAACIRVSHFCFVKQDVLHCPFLTDTSPSALEQQSK